MCNIITVNAAAIVIQSNIFATQKSKM